MALRWTIDDDGIHTAWHPNGAWDGSDLDVGHVTRRVRHDHSGWHARYWGHTESKRWHTGTGTDPAAIGGLWGSLEEAKAAVEEAHAGVEACG
jgi:hypothetical protein